MGYKDSHIKFGECKKPHGIKGGFSFYLYNTDESHLQKNAKVLLVPIDSSSDIQPEGEEYTISSIQFGNKTICYFTEVTDRNAVEAMIPFEIYFSKESLKELPEDEFYFDQLKGLTVLDFDTDEEVGTIIDYYENGPQLVVVIRGKETIELPYISDFFQELNLEAGWVKLKKIEVYSER